ncbi:MAG: MarR family transcriptional regulator [Caldilineales bacterium]|nr:MarR family transcriptional regulator [Caldilineales bacterium]
MSSQELFGPGLELSQDDLRFKLMRLNWLQHRKFAQEIADLDLTVPQFYTLNALVTLGGRSSMGALSRHAHQVSATMTGIVDRLVRDGLVIRERDEQDRRSVVVEITPEGRRLVECAWERALGSLDHTFESLTPTERLTASKLFDSLVAEIEID